MIPTETETNTQKQPKYAFFAHDLLACIKTRNWRTQQTVLISNDVGKTDASPEAEDHDRDLDRDIRRDEYAWGDGC